MVYVERNNNGKIKGIYRQRQRGYAEEFLEENDSELMSYRENSIRNSKKIQVANEFNRRVDLACDRSAQIDALINICNILTKENKSYNDIENRVPRATRYEPTAQEKSMMTEYEVKLTEYRRLQQSRSDLEVQISNSDEQQLSTLDVTDDSHW